MAERCEKCGAEKEWLLEGVCRDCRSAGSEPPAGASPPLIIDDDPTAQRYAKIRDQGKTPESRPRVWPALLVGLGALPLAVVIGTVTLLFLVGSAGRMDLLTRESDLLDWLKLEAQRPSVFLVLVLPGQVLYLLLGLIPAMLSPVPTAERLQLRPSVLPGYSWIVFLLATPAVAQLAPLVFPWLEEDPGANMELLLGLLRGTQGWSLLLIVGLITVAPAFSEEFLFRGYIQGRLLQRWHPVLAIGFVSLVFAAAHLDVAHALAVFPIGVWLGIVAWKSQSLWPAMLCHFGNNLHSCLVAMLLLGTAHEFAYTIALWCISGTALLIGLAIVFFIRPVSADVLDLDGKQVAEDPV